MYVITQKLAYFLYPLLSLVNDRYKTRLSIYSTSKVMSVFHITSLLKTVIMLRKCIQIATELHEVNENGEWQKSVKKC